MVKSWKEVESSPDFLALPHEEKVAARDQYFNSVVAPQVPANERDVVYEKFKERSGLESSVLSSMGRTAGGAFFDTIGSVSQGLAISDARDASEAGKKNRATLDLMDVIASTPNIDDSEISNMLSERGLTPISTSTNRMGAFAPVSPEKSIIDQFTQATRSGNTALAQKIRDDLKGAEFSAEEASKPTNYTSYGVGKTIRDFGSETFPTTPEEQDRWYNSYVASPLAQTAGFAGAGIAGGAVGGAPGAAMSVAALGSSVGRTGDFDAAINSGATLDQALAASDYGAAFGLTEAVPITHWLERTPLGKLSGDAAKGFVRTWKEEGISAAIKKMAGESGIQGLEEGFQEFVQNTGSNLGARETYDPNRGLLEGAGEATAAGAGAGVALGALGTLLPGRKRGAPGGDVVPDVGSTGEPTLPPEGQAAPGEPLRINIPNPAALNQPRPANPPPLSDTELAAELNQVMNTDRPISDIIDEKDFPDKLPDETVIMVDDGEGTEASGYAYYNEKTKSIRYPGELPPPPPPVSVGRQWQDVAPDAVLPPGAQITTDPTTGAQKARMTTSNTPVKVENPQDLEAAATRAASSPANNLPEPTQAQKEAGNYRKAHVDVQGLNISIETPAGGERSGMGADGNEWRVKMPAHYGYVKRTEGADGEQVDVFLGDNPKSQQVWVIDQKKADTQEFDEHKAMIGYNTPKAALDAYMGSFSDNYGQKVFSGIHRMQMDEFKDWLKGDTTKPIGKMVEQPAPQEPRAAEAAPAPAAIPPGLQKTYDQLDRAIANYDTGVLNNILGNMDNKNSREYFEKKTGVTLPKGVARTKVAVERWYQDSIMATNQNETPLDFTELKAGITVGFPNRDENDFYEVISNDGNTLTLKNRGTGEEIEMDKTSSGFEILSQEAQIITEEKPQKPLEPNAAELSREQLQQQLDDMNRRIEQAYVVDSRVMDKKAQLEKLLEETSSAPRYTVKKADIVPTRAGVIAVPQQQENTDVKNPEPETDESAQGNTIDDLHRHLQSRISEGHTWPSIAQLRREAAKYTGTAIEPNTEAAKQVDEQAEIAYNLAARDIVSSSKNTGDVYDKLVKLYESQPTLSQRSSTSVELQAYSTPAPISYVASHLAGVTSNDNVLEPTAGNGSLLIKANPANTKAVELDKNRFESLRKIFPNMGAVIESDFLALSPHQKQFDVILTNPPFGRMPNNGSYPIGSSQTDQLDQAIVLQALKSMKADGRAVLIIGSKRGMKSNPDDIRNAYNTANSRLFFKHLYDNYNVTDHFTLAGGLYKKQGAEYPIDIIAINGAGKSALSLPGVKAPRLYESFEQLKEVLNDNTQRAIYSQEKQPADAGDSGQSDRKDERVGVPERDNVANRIPDISGEGQAGREIGNTGAAENNRAGRPAVSTGGTTGSVGERTATPPAVRGDAESGSAGGSERVQPQESRAERGDTGGRTGSDNVSSREREPRKVLEDKVSESGLQISYNPTSKAKSLDTLIPVKMNQAVKRSLSRIEDEVGDIDKFVTKELGYGSVSELHENFGAEQIEAVALAIRNMQKRSGFIIGDQTGIGKGRVNAAVLRYARLNGKVPLFVTKDPTLYADMYRDLHAIGERNFKALITNTGGDLRGNKAIYVEETGDTIASLTPKAYESAFNTLVSTGKLPEGYDYLFTTYAQMTVIKGKPELRHKAIEAIVENAVMSLDESHMAGGQAQGGMKFKKKSKDGDTVPEHYESRAKFVRYLVDLSPSVLYSSATYAKNPDVMDLYRKTDIKLAVEKLNDLGDTIRMGGVPLQQVLANMLVESGQYVRREKSYDGIKMELTELKVDHAQADRVADALRRIFEFDQNLEDIRKEMKEEARATAEAYGADNAISQAGLSSTNFSSIMHNIVSQALMAAKIREVAKTAKQLHDAGEKVVIALVNTNESILTDYMQENELKIGDTANELNFSTLFQRYLSRTRRMLRKDSEGNKVPIRLTDAQIGEDATREYNELMADLKKEDFGNAPVSPIDFLLAEFKKNGIRADEITGREKILTYKPDGNQIIEQRSGGAGDKKKIINRFNSGELDAVILNESGATGVSLHASSKFKDQKKRTMIILQPAPNIDTYMQMLGRINRTGQTKLPDYHIVVSDIPVERRPAAVLMRKLASLNANTTANKRGATTIDSVTDFMNKYGDDLVAELLQDEPSLRRTLGIDFGTDENANDGLASKLTGRLAILPVKEQARVLDMIEDRYKTLIKYLDSIGENALEAKELNLRAITTGIIEVSPSTGDSPFTEAVNMEQVSVKRIGKPYTPEQVQGKIKETLGGKSPADYSSKLKAQYEEDTSSEWSRIEQRWKNAEAENNDVDKARRRFEDSTALREVIMDFLSTYRVGNNVMLKSDDGNLHGIIIDISRDKSSSPVALGQFKITIAIADATREITIPLSQAVQRPGEQKPPRYELSPSHMNKERMDEMFSVGQRDVRDQRYMITGNLFKGFDQFKQGKITFYTRDDGTVAQGILMPSTFDPADALSKLSISLRSPQEAAALLREIPRSSVTTQDGIVTIERDYVSAGLYKISVKRTGGRDYYTSKALREALGQDLYSRTGDFTQTFSPDKLPSVYKAIEIAGGVWSVKRDQDFIRKLRGEKEVIAKFQTSLRASGSTARWMPTKTWTDNKKKIAGEIEALAAERFGKDLKIKFADSIIDSKGEEQFGAFTIQENESGAPEYWAIVSLNSANKDKKGTLNHEGIHYLRAIGAIENAEWEVLRNKAYSEWIGRYNIRDRYRDDTGKPADEELIIEEAIAEAFAEKARWNGYPQIVRKVFAAIERFMDAIRSVLNRNGIDRASQIFSNWSAGRFEKASAPQVPLDAAVQRYQLNSHGKTFYSALVRAIETSKLNRAPARDWKAFIRNQNGIKEEEISWSGVEDWLDRQSGTVLKADLLKYLETEAAVNIEEVYLLGNSAPVISWAGNTLLRNDIRYGEVYEMTDFDDKKQWYIRLEGATSGQDKIGYKTESAAKHELELVALAESYDQESGDTKYDKYTVPGGENYKELLFTLPGDTKLTPNERAEKMFGKPYKDLSLEEQRKVVDEGNNKQFLTSHYQSHSNILAHVRFKERTIADGKRIIFVEEVQSDWHQKGRDKGYYNPNRLAEAKAATQAYNAFGDKMNEKYGAVWGMKMTREELSEMQELKSKTDFDNDHTSGRVPDAPLKKTWHEMVMKRMLRYASERGFDGLAWATGDINADHYGQREKAGIVEYHDRVLMPRMDDKEGARRLVVRRVDAKKGILLDENIPPAELPKILGKELAARLTAAPMQEGKKDSIYYTMQTVNANGALVGGHGMRGFYDDILPRFMRSYTKKWKGNVTDITLKVVDKDTSSRAARYDEEPATKDVKVHYIEITPDMQEAVLKGQPLFQRATKTEQPASLTLSMSDEGIRDVILDGNMTLMEKVKAIGKKDTIRASVDHWRRFMQDRFLHWHRVQKKIEEITGQPLSERLDVYGAEELYSGRAGERLSQLERKHKEPLIQRIADFNNQYGDGVETIEKFLYALHAEERNVQIAKINPKFPNDGTPNSGGSGMDADEIEAIMQQAKKAGQYDQLMEIASGVHEMLKDSLRFRLDSGLITREYYDTLTETYKNYVPLKGISEQGFGDSTGLGVKIGKGMDVRGREFIAAKGRKSKASDLLANSFAIADEAIIRGEKNRVENALYNLVQKYPSDMWEVASPALRPILNKATGLIEYRATPMPKNMKLNDFTVGLKVDGVQKLITIKDKRLAEPMKNLNVDKVHGLLKFMLTYNRFLSQVNTSFNPEFIITNAFRDIQTASINMAQYDLKGLGKATRRDYFRALKGSYGGVKGKDSTEWQQYFREYAAAGGKVSFFAIDDINARKTQLKRDVSRLGEGIIPFTRRQGKAIMELVENANGAVENAIRLSAFVNARRRGLSDAEAARLAKNLTVNFNKRGELATQMNGMYLFYNASMQSAFVMLNALKSRPVQYMAGSLVLLGLAEAILNNMMSPDDDDGESVYDKIPQYEKEANIILVDPTGQLSAIADGIFVIGKIGEVRYIKIPMAYGYRVFHELGRATGAVLTGKETAGEAVGNVASSIVNNFNPIGGEESLLSFVSPTILDPLVSVSANKTFTGSKIRPEPSQFDKSPPPPSEQYFPNVSDISRVITRELNELTGGDKIQAGKISISPEIMDYMFSQFTGAAGAFIGRTVDTATKAITGEEMSISDVPFARQVFGGKKVWIDRTNAYDRMDEVVRLQDNLKDYYKLGENEKAKKLLSDNKEVLELRGLEKETREQLSTLRKRRIMTENSRQYTKEQKEVLVKRIETAEERIITEFNKRYLKAVSTQEQDK